MNNSNLPPGMNPMELEPDTIDCPNCHQDLGQVGIQQQQDKIQYAYLEVGDNNVPELVWDDEGDLTDEGPWRCNNCGQDLTEFLNELTRQGLRY